MTTTAKNREEFAHIMGKEAPGMPFDEVRRLMKLAATCQRLAEKACNEPMTEADVLKYDHTADNIRRICAEAHCATIIGGDPRGAVVKVTVPSGRTNDWGNEGICVPS